MTETLWIVVILAALMVVGLLILRPWVRRGSIRVPGAEVEIETHEPERGACAGAHMEGVEAAGNARVNAIGGGPATMKQVKAGGDAEVVSGRAQRTTGPNA